jgi:hypothetical protein
MPQLVGVDGTVGVTVQTSTAASALQPFATLQLHLQSVDGARYSEQMQLTIPQLKALEIALKEAASALERA